MAARVRTSPASYAMFLARNHEQGMLGHYFRVLFHVFKHIDESELEENEKMNVASLARAQLTIVELGLLLSTQVQRAAVCPVSRHLGGSLEHSRDSQCGCALRPVSPLCQNKPDARAEKKCSAL